eukprot:scaffold251449_cov18-Tisochrysis_lutea.AAC.1
MVHLLTCEDGTAVGAHKYTNAIATAGMVIPHQVLAAAAAAGAAAAINNPPGNSASGANTPSGAHLHKLFSRDGGLRQARQQQQQQQQHGGTEPRGNAPPQQGPSRLALTRPPQLA